MMTTIEEGNKLIAELMGFKFNAYPDLKHNNITKPGDNEWYFASWGIEEFNAHLTHEFKYHTSWDWLKTAIDKAHDECKLYSDGLKFFEGLTIFSTIQQVWDSLIQFIQWFNNQKQ